MSDRLEGLSMLVTGGGSGIGRAVVDAYVAEGAAVTVVEFSADRAAEVERSHDGAVIAVIGDACEPDVVRAALATALKQGRLDHVTCVVGAFDFYQSIRDVDAATLAEAASEIWRRNVWSALLAVNLCQDALGEANGSVTLTLSGAAYRPEGGGVLYGSSKAALHGVVLHLAADLAPRVRVNGVAPGGTSETGLGGLSALGQSHTAADVEGRDERIRAGTALGVLAAPADHAPAYVYLADPMSGRVVTSTVLHTDGGHA